MLDMSEGEFKKSEPGPRLETPLDMSELIGKFDLCWPPNKWPGGDNMESREKSYSDFVNILFPLCEPDNIAGLSFSLASIGSGLVLGVEINSVEATSMLGELGSRSSELNLSPPLEPSCSLRSLSDFRHLALRFCKKKYFHQKYLL